MDLRELFELKTSESPFKRTVLCNVKDETGWNIKSIEEFQKLLTTLKNKVTFVVSNIPNEKLDYYEVLVLSRAPIYGAFIKHPLLTNPYYKILPDEIFDVAFDPNNLKYQYSKVEYGNKLTDFVIEFPDSIKDTIVSYLQHLPAKPLKIQEHMLLSVIVTNTDRFLNMSLNKDVTLITMDAFRDLLQIKSNNMQQITKKLWEDLKFLLS